MNREKFFSKALPPLFELVAVVFSLAYTILYLTEYRICYLFGFIGSLLLAFVYLREKLFAEFGLQCVYVGLAIYGAYHPLDWHQPNPSQWNHFLIVSIGIFMVIVLGILLRRLNTSGYVWADSFVAVSAIIGTWLMVTYSEACWLYLLASNCIALLICVMKKLFSTSFLYLVYVLLSIDGYWDLQISNQISHWIALHLGLL